MSAASPGDRSRASSPVDTAWPSAPGGSGGVPAATPAQGVRSAPASEEDERWSCEQLRARLRRGDITLRQVELAAYVGARGPRELVGPTCSLAVDPSGDGSPILVDERSPLADFVTGLARWGDRAEVCAAVAALQVALPVWALAQVGTARPDPARGPAAAAEPVARARATLDALERWLTNPIDHDLRASLDASGAGDAVAQPLPEAVGQGAQGHGFAETLARVAVRARGAVDPGACGAAAVLCARWVGEARVRERLRAQLVAWALGSSAKRGSSAPPSGSHGASGGDAGPDDSRQVGEPAAS